ncbi:MAG: NAD(P)/FAD-dependent oxidoreductase [Flavobacteriales bacterium]|nr:NAD(P)/FAD-dependent oxidoreductase [Flavobacteriales bacterium]
MKIAIIGGGAAGFFSAISTKTNYPEADVTIYEKSDKLLAKVRISGGGRCNVTNGCTSINELCKAYPRGGKNLKKAFHVFNTTHTKEWFELRGVPLKTEDDQRVFPTSNNSESIVDCLMNEVKKLEIKIRLGSSIKEIIEVDDQIQLSFDKSNTKLFSKVIIAAGGSPKRKGLEWLETLGHKIINPVPSLFTFNIPNNPITKLMGLAVENTLVNIQGTKLKSSGPLLITHWGMSGPAILKLSSFGARDLSDMGYHFKAQVNWVNEPNNDIVMNQLRSIGVDHGKKLVTNMRPFQLPERLWLVFLNKSEIPLNKVWGELSKKSLNKLVSTLTNDIYEVRGKTTFKEEFVTCGGVSLDSINLNTMQSKVCKHLYFAGEVIDIDAITGGYNFQAAWTTGFIAGKLG